MVVPSRVPTIAVKECQHRHFQVMVGERNGVRGRKDHCGGKKEMKEEVGSRVRKRLTH